MRHVLWGILGLGCAALLVGCGDNDGSGGPASSTTGGTGGNLSGAGGADTGGTGTGGAGTGGSSSGGAGTGGGIKLPDGPLSKRAACRAYVQAQCERRAECSNDPTRDCTWSAIDMCPDLLFSEGSQRTAEQVVECAEEWLTFDCNSVLLDKLPSCAIPGTLELGGWCIHPSQCASGACNGSTNVCGQCIPVVASGGACDDFSACPDGEICESGQCVSFVPVVLESNTGAEGDPCYRNHPNCQSGLTCVSDDARSTTICRPNPIEGASCYYAFTTEDTRTCDSNGETYCGPDLLCHAAPTQGQLCVVASSAQNVCGSGLFCSADTATCEPVPGWGEPCGTVGASGGSPGGQICAGSLCDAGICKEIREEGESCAEANTRCADGTECADGVCRATDQLALYGQLCTL